MTKTLK